MTHPGSAKLLRYTLGELSSESRLSVDRHVAGCARCRRLVAEERRLDELIVGSLGATPTATDGEAAFERLWADVDRESSAQPESVERSESAEGRVGRELASRNDVRILPEHAARTRRVASLVTLWPLAAAAAVLATVVWWPVDRGAEPVPIQDRGPVVDLPDEMQPLLVIDAPVVDLPAMGAAIGEGAWEPVDPARLEVARATVGGVLRAADEQFPFAVEAFRLACDEGLAQLRSQGWPVAALVRGLALGTDDLTAGAALRHAALERSSYLVLARALESDSRLDDALAVLDSTAVDVGASSSLVKALERIAEPDDGDLTPGAGRRRTALGILAAGTGPRARHAWTRLADRRGSALTRSRDATRAAVLLDEAAELWPPDIAVALLEDLSGEKRLHEASRAAFLAHVGRLDEAAARHLDDSLTRRRGPPVLLAWCVAADLNEIVPALVRALEEGHEPANLLPALMAFGGTDAAAGLHGLWRDAHSASKATVFLGALDDLFGADETLARRFGATVSLEASEQLADLAEALPDEARRGLLAGALSASQRLGDPGGHRAALLMALGRTGSMGDGQDLLAWIGERPAQDSMLPLAWAAAGRLAPDAAMLAWRERIGDPRLLTDVVDAVSPRLAVAVQPSARTLAPLSAALALAASLPAPRSDQLPNSNIPSPSPSMKDLP